MEIKEDKVFKHLKEDYKQTWEHYRHLENARTKYMNFYISAIFTIIGFCATLLKFEYFKSTEYDAFIGIVILCPLSAFTLFVYINIKRIGWVLDDYGRVAKVIRELLYNENVLYKLNAPSKHIFKDNKSKIYSIQRSALILLIIAMVVIDLLMILVLYYKWNASGVNIWLATVTVFTICIEVCVCYVGLNGHIKQTIRRKRKRYKVDLIIIAIIIALLVLVFAYYCGFMRIDSVENIYLNKGIICTSLEIGFRLT